MVSGDQDLFKHRYIAVFTILFFSVGHRDITSFTAAKVALRNAANIFAQDQYNPINTPVPDVPLLETPYKELQRWLRRVTIQLAVSFASFGGSLPTESDAATLNTTFVPSTQAAILHNLHGLQAGIAFFENVNNSPPLTILLIGPVGTVQSTAAFANNIWLTKDAFACGNDAHGTKVNLLVCGWYIFNAESQPEVSYVLDGIGRSPAASFLSLKVLLAPELRRRRPRNITTSPFNTALAAATAKLPPQTSPSTIESMVDIEPNLPPELEAPSKKTYSSSLGEFKL
ncbi:hypothetical protein B0H14DRAFT_3443498 [Mycena olivaceomarginata]|nr:hypothetical protein B0H14DRAFT_3443498 [Mycena olivaceomarginata]